MARSREHQQLQQALDAFVARHGQTPEAGAARRVLESTGGGYEQDNIDGRNTPGHRIASRIMQSSATSRTTPSTPPARQESLGQNRAASSSRPDLTGQAGRDRGTGAPMSGQAERQGARTLASGQDERASRAPNLSGEGGRFASSRPDLSGEGRAEGRTPESQVTGDRPKAPPQRPQPGGETRLDLPGMSVKARARARLGPR